MEPGLAYVGRLCQLALCVPRRVLRLGDMPGTGPQRGGAEGVVAMSRAGMIAALLGLLEA